MNRLCWSTCHSSCANCSGPYSSQCTKCKAGKKTHAFGLARVAAAAPPPPWAILAAFEQAPGRTPRRARSMHLPPGRQRRPCPRPSPGPSRRATTASTQTLPPGCPAAVSGLVDIRVRLDGGVMCRAGTLDPALLLRVAVQGGASRWARGAATHTPAVTPRWRSPAAEPQTAGAGVTPLRFPALNPQPDNTRAQSRRALRPATRSTPQP